MWGPFLALRIKHFGFFMFWASNSRFFVYGDGFESLGVDVLKVPLMTNLADVSTKNPFFSFSGPSVGSAKVLSMGSIPNPYLFLMGPAMGSAKIFRITYSAKMKSLISISSRCE